MVKPSILIFSPLASVSIKGFDFCNPICFEVNKRPLGESFKKREILIESVVEETVENKPPLTVPSELYLAKSAIYSPAGESSGRPPLM